MDETYILKYLLIFFVTFIQTIVGTGVLIVGTPALLLLNYEMIEIMRILLPISIITSLTNLLINRNICKNKEIFNNSELKSFFFVCVPSIFLGLFLLREFGESFNFDILVALIILLTLIINEKLKYFNFFLLEKTNYLINLIIGVVHGLTNCGGSLLSLFIISKGNKNKDLNFYKITFFYFFLALFQYLLFLYFFGFQSKFFFLNYIFVFITLGILFGNFLLRKFNINLFKNLIKILSLISVIMLVGKNFF